MEMPDRKVVISEAIDMLPPLDLEGVELEEIKGKIPLYKVFHTSINEELCSGCRLCENACTSLIFDNAKKIMRINENSCKGCGTCVAICPSGALRQVLFSDAAIFNAMEERVKEEAVTALSPFYCLSCPISAVNLSKEYSPDGCVIRLMCSGWLNTSFMLESFEKGVAGVLIINCFLGIIDSQRKRLIEYEIEKLHNLMNILGINTKRLRLEWISAYDNQLQDVLKDFYEELMGEEK